MCKLQNTAEVSAFPNINMCLHQMHTLSPIFLQYQKGSSMGQEQSMLKYNTPSPASQQDDISAHKIPCGPAWCRSG